MLGVVLLFVGIVLLNNGLGRLTGIDKKAVTVLNVLVGSLSVIANVVTIVQANGEIANFYSAGTGLLFGFTYLFIAANNLFDLDLRAYGWYSLMVAVITVPAAYLCFIAGDWRFGAIWLMWGVLWLTGFIETVAKKDLGHFVSFLLIFEGIVTALVPGFLILADRW